MHCSRRSAACAGRARTAHRPGEIGCRAGRAPKGFAPIAIGLALTLIHLVSIPVTNTSVNPARSIGPALFVGGDAITQLWLFILAPIVGAILGAAIYSTLLARAEPPEG